MIAPLLLIGIGTVVVLIAAFCWLFEKWFDTRRFKARIRKDI